MKQLLTSALLAGVLALPASAQLITPSPLTVQGSTGVRTDFTLTFDTAQDTLQIGIFNDVLSPTNVKGRLTGFAFNLPDIAPNNWSNATLVAETLSSTTLAQWSVFVNATLNAGAGFDFDLGAGTGPNINGGGGNGVFWGETGTLTLKFGFDVDAAFVASVQSYYSQNQGNFMGARWQSLTGTTEGSDAGTDLPPGPSGGGVVTVPEPATYGLFGAVAALALLVTRRRR